MTNQTKCKKGGVHDWEYINSTRLGLGAKRCKKCDKTTSDCKKIHIQGTAR